MRVRVRGLGVGWVRGGGGEGYEVMFGQLQ